MLYLQPFHFNWLSSSLRSQVRLRQAAQSLAQPSKKSLTCHDPEHSTELLEGTYTTQSAYFLERRWIW